jgi:ectoine hydroxylase-related dioxygenase (phytanoyl-CoA dioxygenase family)
MNISPEQKEFYQANGFLTGYPILSSDEADELLHDYLAFMRGERFHPQWKTGGLSRFQKLPLLSHHIKTPVMESLLTRARSLGEQLVGGDLFLWGDQTVMKPAGSEVNVAWHQDLAYWWNYPRKQALRRDERAITCWVALGDVGQDMGPVSFVAGSHQETYPHHCVSVPTDDYNVDDRLFVDPALVTSSGKRIFQSCLKKGQCSFHDSGTLHGSGPNRSSSPRYGYTLHFWPGKRRETRRLPSRSSWLVQWVLRRAWA